MKDFSSSAVAAVSPASAAVDRLEGSAENRGRGGEGESGGRDLVVKDASVDPSNTPFTRLHAAPSEAKSTDDNVVNVWKIINQEIHVNHCPWV